jgi:hypothetical protein
MIPLETIGEVIEEYIANRSFAKRDDILYHYLEKVGLSAAMGTGGTRKHPSLVSARRKITAHMQAKAEDWNKLGGHKATRWERVPA